MNIYLIEEYVNRLRKEDISNFALKQGIVLDDDEIGIIYSYIKSNYKTIIYGNPKDILLEIKSKVKPLTYNKIENIYIKFKDKIDLFNKKNEKTSYLLALFLLNLYQILYSLSFLFHIYMEDTLYL